MALFSQGTTSRHKHISFFLFVFKKGIVANLPLTERETLSTLFSLFQSSLYCQLTI